MIIKALNSSHHHIVNSTVINTSYNNSNLNASNLYEWNKQKIFQSITDKVIQIAKSLTETLKSNNENSYLIKHQNSFLSSNVAFSEDESDASFDLIDIETITSTTTTTTSRLVSSTPGAINNLTLQILLLFVLALIIGALFLSIQAFVEYEKFKQLYGSDLNLAIILKSIFKAVYVRIVVFKQKKSIFHRGRNLRQTQFDLLKTILKHQLNPYDKQNEFINNELKIKQLFSNCKNDLDLENLYKTKLELNDRQFYLQYMSIISQNQNQVKLNQKALSLNTLNWLVEKPEVFYGELFSFYASSVPYEHPKDGISVGAGYFKIKLFINDQTSLKLYEHGIEDEDFCYYIQVTYALSRTSITVMHCYNMYVLYKVFYFIINDWTTMCDSIEKGTFLLPAQLQFKIENLFHNTNTYNRFRQEKLSNILKPNLKRANELRLLFRRLTGDNAYESLDSKSLAIKIWPNLEYVISTVTGTLNCQLSLLRDYLSKSVKMVSHMHLCDRNLLLGYSMHRYNVESNIQSEEPIFVSTYDQTYFEFIDVDLIKAQLSSNEPNLKQLETTKLCDVIQNKEYEVVITNFSSIYRYRTGHVIKFTRVQPNSPPLYTFQFRLENWLNIGSIYLDEKIILKKLNLISQLSKCLIVDYTTCVFNMGKLRLTGNLDTDDEVEQEFYRRISTNDNLSCFILFIEFKALKNSECALKMKLGIADLFDEYICNANKEYAQYRKEFRIDKFRVYELKTGAFEIYKNYLINEKYKRTGNVEYETPRTLTDYYDANLLLNLKLD